MSAREQINSVRIVNVTQSGAGAGFGSLGKRLKNLSSRAFVALDTEFSSLGSDPDLKNENLSTRYTALRNLAHSNAILSVGISVFDTPPTDVLIPSLSDATQSLNPAPYLVSTYDFLLRCNTPFVMSSKCGEFLVRHGFDFNRLFHSGISYDSACTEKEPEKTPPKNIPWQWDKLPRGLLWRIGHSKVPVIVHNGLFDLVFLYASFQAPLPESLTDFISSLRECIPEGIWDSKILASVAKEPSSSLPYLFAKAVLSETVAVQNSADLPHDENANPPPHELEGREELCASFSLRGFCIRSVSCPFSHDAFRVIQEEKEGRCPKDAKEMQKKHKLQSKLLKKKTNICTPKTTKKSRKRKERLAISASTTQLPTSGTEGVGIEPAHDTSSDPLMTDVITNAIPEIEEPSPNPAQSSAKVNENQTHTAGWDAFCTGFIFAAYRETMSSEIFEKEKDRVAVSSSGASLLLQESQFSDLDTKKVE